MSIILCRNGSHIKQARFIACELVILYFTACFLHRWIAIEFKCSLNKIEQEKRNKFYNNNKVVFLYMFMEIKFSWGM